MNTSGPSHDTNVIEVFADVWCPFTHVGLRTWTARRDASGRSDLRLWVRAWPLELVNGVPLDADVVEEEVDDLRTQVCPDLFTGFDPAHWPTSSLPALDLAASAYEIGLDAGERTSLLLREALFERGLDIGSGDVLRDLASEAGVPLPGPGARALVEADWASGRARDVVGSPHFFINHTGFFCPALNIARAGSHLRIQPDPAAFDSFFHRCLAA